jgi:hypothetical protein
MAVIYNIEIITIGTKFGLSRPCRMDNTLGVPRDIPFGGIMINSIHIFTI